MANTILYNNLIEVLGGKKYFTSKEGESALIKDWSPNLYKILVISQDFVMSVTHTGRVSMKQIDRGFLSQELAELYNSGKSRPELNSIFNKRSLTCLEEIYIDQSINLPFVVDLSKLVDSLTSSRNSRLRKYGVGVFDINTANVIQETVRNISAFPQFYDFSITDKRLGLNIRFKDLNNSDWYKKKALREHYYGVDKPKRNLAVYLNKVEAYMLKNLNSQVQKAKDDRVLEGIMEYVNSDIKSLSYSGRINKIVTYIKNYDNEDAKMLKKVFSDVLARNKEIKGLTPDFLEEQGVSSEMQKFYENFNLLSSAKTSSLSDIKKPDWGSEFGFINLQQFMDLLCAGVASELGRSSVRYKIALKSAGYIPKGKLDSNGGKENEIEGYFEFLSQIIGMSLKGD